MLPNGNSRAADKDATFLIPAAEGYGVADCLTVRAPNAGASSPTPIARRRASRKRRASAGPRPEDVTGTLDAAVTGPKRAADPHQLRRLSLRGAGAPAIFTPKSSPPGSGTMTPHLHPSEVRAPAPGKRAGRKRLRALQIGVAAAAVAASFAATAYVVTQLPEEEPAPKVTFNRIEDWPEIKNGVRRWRRQSRYRRPRRVRCSAAHAGARAACRASPAADFCGAPVRGGGCRRIGPERRAGRSRTPKRGAPLPGSETGSRRARRARLRTSPERRPSAQRSRDAGGERGCGIRAGFAGRRGGDRATRGAGRREDRQSPGVRCSADRCREPASDAAC